MDTQRLGSVARRARGFATVVDHALFPPDGSALTAALRRALPPGAGSVLDVGCGDRGMLPGRLQGFSRIVGVDMVLPRSDAVIPRHSEYRRIDIRSLSDEFKEDEFNQVVALDVIEHLTRQEGEELLMAMERIASERVVIFTPNGFLPQQASADNPRQEHVSGWTVADFRSRGFVVEGVNGWKVLRGTYAEIRWRPRGFWRRVSALSQHVTRRFPTMAFQLFAVKHLVETGDLRGAAD